jgi:hypothetical protein
MATTFCNKLHHPACKGVGWDAQKGGSTGLMHSFHPLHWRAVRLLFKHSYTLPFPFFTTLVPNNPSLAGNSQLPKLHPTHSPKITQANVIMTSCMRTVSLNSIQGMMASQLQFCSPNPSSLFLLEKAKAAVNLSLPRNVSQFSYVLNAQVLKRRYIGFIAVFTRANHWMLQ